jgi:hypothetical protein
LDVLAIPFTEWQRQMGIVARNLQRKVAQSFAAQKTAGRSALKANDPNYTAGKIRRGEDPRRGHKTNALQQALNSAKLTMVTLTMQGPNEAAARIVMEEPVLHAMVPHSLYYEEMKVRTAGILSLAASWVRDEALKLTARMRAAQAKRIQASQNVLRQNLAARQSNAATILARIAQPFAGQSIIRNTLEARRANAANILKRRGR